MTYPEQIELLEGIRKRREVEQAAVQQRKHVATKRTSRSKVNKTKDLLAKLPDVDRAAMLALMAEDI